MANTRLFQNLVCTAQGTFAPLYLRRLVYGNNDKFVTDRWIRDDRISRGESLSRLKDENKKRERSKPSRVSFAEKKQPKRVDDEEEIERRLIGMSGMEKDKKGNANRDINFSFYILVLDWKLNSIIAKLYVYRYSFPSKLDDSVNKLVGIPISRMERVKIKKMELTRWQFLKTPFATPFVRKLRQ